MVKIDIVAVLSLQDASIWYWYCLKEDAPPRGYFQRLFPDFSAANPILKLDKDWEMSWKRFDEMVVVTIGHVEPNLMEIVSDNEDSEEEDSEEDDVNEPLQKQSNSYSLSNYSNPVQNLVFLSIFIDAIKTFINSESLSKHKIILNSHKITMILQEMIDAGIPFIIDINQLREHIPSDSILNAILSTTKQIQNTATNSIANFKQGGISAISSNFQSIGFNTGGESNYPIILDKSGCQTPWRAESIIHNENELFVDLTETIDLIVFSSSSSSLPSSSYSFSNFNYGFDHLQYSKATINGSLDLRSSLNGKPIVTINLDSPILKSFDSIGKEANNLFDSSVILHKCVNKEIWKNQFNLKQIQCTPPDGKSNLLKYSIDIIELEKLSNKLNNSKGGDYFNKNKYLGLIEVELKTGLCNPISNNLNNYEKNEFEITLKTGGSGLIDSVKEIDNLSIFIDLPNGFDLKIIRSSNGSIMKSIDGKWKWELESPVVLNGTFILRCSIISTFSNNNNGLNNIIQTSVIKQVDNKLNEMNYMTDSQLDLSNKNQISITTNELIDDNNNNNDILKPNFLNVKFSYKGALFTNTKVQNIDIFDDGETNKFKPFKGVKYLSKSDDFIVR